MHSQPFTPFTHLYLRGGPLLLGGIHLDGMQVHGLHEAVPKRLVILAPEPEVDGHLRVHVPRVHVVRVQHDHALCTWRGERTGRV